MTFLSLTLLMHHQGFNAKGRPPYSSAMIRFALHLRYTSLQSYKLLLEKFPLPSISTLHRIQAGGVDSLKAVKKLREKGHMRARACVWFGMHLYVYKYC